MCYSETMNHKGIKIIISDCFGVGFDWRDEEFKKAVENKEERLFEALRWMSNGGAKLYNDAVCFENDMCRGSYLSIYYNFTRCNYNFYEMRQNPYISERTKNLLDMFFSGELAKKAGEEREAKRTQPKPKKISRGIVYLLNSGIYYKIGKTKNLPARMESLAVGVIAPFNIKLIHHYTSNDYSVEESRLHNMFSEKRTDGEWFTLSKEDVEYICSLEGVK